MQHAHPISPSELAPIALWPKAALQMRPAPDPLVAPRAPCAAASLSFDYLLDLMALARGSGDLLEGLILGVIASASVSRLSEDPVLDAAFATLGAALPDGLRRPITVHAVAASLSLPYETVRRRVHKLAEAGGWLMTPAGVIHPESAETHPRYVAEAVARYDRTRRFYLDRLAADATPLRQARPFQQYAPEAPVRLVSRVAADYSLRLTDAILRETGDLTKAVILMEIVRSGSQPRRPRACSPGQGPSRPRRRAVSAAELSNRLQIPAETLRRHIGALIHNGLVIRRPRGFIVSPAGLQQSGLEAVARGDSGNLRRLFGQLDRAGVLERWDAEVATSKACA